jgi:hypothetical protein
MKKNNSYPLNDRRTKNRALAKAWVDQAPLSLIEETLQPDSNRLAFADAEFLQRRETRGIRFQLEMLKPDLEQARFHINHTVVVFGSARFDSEEIAKAKLAKAEASGSDHDIADAKKRVQNARYYEQAREFARIVANYSGHTGEANRLYVATGGGPGIMEAANRGAHEVGAPTVGLNITLPHEQQPNPYITPNLSFKFHYFAARKMHFMMRAKALVAFPGGFGTLDELFEVITLVQTKKAEPVPIVLFGKDYWRRLINFDMLVEEGVVSAQDLDLLHFTDSPQEAWDMIRRFYDLPT